MINVTKPFLPPQEEYNKVIEGIWDRVWLTNNGPLVQELEKKLQHYLEVPSIQFVTNGTMALQLAIKALNLKGEIITTPFSFVATTTAIIWENCNPVYVDIRPDTLCIDANKIEEAITEKTSAILATHVYGIPCDVEKIDQIAKKYNLKVIYDAAHAFGVKYKGKSLLKYGDISTLSFHATKLYHTIEGGGIVNNIGLEIDENLQLLRNFGLQGENSIIEGINAKNSEFHAAMGLCNLKYIDIIHQRRMEITDRYDRLLKSYVERPKISKEVDYNYSYYPIFLQSEEEVVNVIKELKQKKIFARRYFYPSLNQLSYIKGQNDCLISDENSKKVLCLPFYYDLKNEEIDLIANIIVNCLERN